MKKTIFILTLLSATISSCAAFAKCNFAPDMGNGFVKCEDKEAICYVHIEGRAGEAPISCFKK